MKFPQVNPKQSFGEMEEKILSYWKENKTFEKSISTRSEKNPYRFYDGPPFITGTPHYGSLLSSIVKDVVPRYWTMKGKRVERRWGWDCHGIPIEDKVQKKLGLESSKDVERVGIKKFIEECYSYTRETSAEWEWYVDHIGRWVDFTGSYKTMDQDYMESVMWVFKQFYDKGLIYQGKRVSLYSTKLSTPISNFEVAMDNSYEDVNDPAITVMFDLSKNGPEWANTYALAWTTTPWTMPSHIALAINKDIEYAKVESEGKFYVVAAKRAESVFKGKEYSVVETISAEKLHLLSYTPPFDFYVGKIDDTVNHRIHYADFVNDEDGTGIAHEAPEFGDVDFMLAKEVGLYITESMDKEGKYTSQLGQYEGLFYRDANPIMMDLLAEKGILFKKESITHRVAMCPRTGIPLVYKTQDSYFIDIQSLKPRLAEANEQINWFPEHFKHGRFLKSMEGAPDWCVSRTRYWATPMPVWIGYDEKGQEKDKKVFGSIAEIEAASGMKVTDLHRPYIDEITWQENGLTYRRVVEVLDGWLDSGSMPYAQMHYPFENKQSMEASFPADFIVEYVGQIRAWFYVMHVVGVALFDKPSFTNVITTGTIYGNDGRKMSKSYGNYPDPKETLKKYGGDAMRMYLVNSPLLSGADIDFKEEGVIEVAKKVLLPLWNAYSFFTTYAQIDNFDPETGNIFLMRHGQTEANVQGYAILGEENPGLNETGKKQAQEAGKMFGGKQMKLDVIVCSNKARAQETAQIVAKELGYTVPVEVWNAPLLAKDIEKGYAQVKEKYAHKNVLLVGHSEAFGIVDIAKGQQSSTTFNERRASNHNGKVIELPTILRKNQLDVWIMSELELLVANVSTEFEQYDLQKAAAHLVGFLDNLTNWYIRRSRRRFWKSENDWDKLQAYQTLYDVLVKFTKVAAPFIPFVSEEIWRGLTNGESVHLEDYPTINGDFVNDALKQDMARTQQIVSLGLALRSSKKVRVRQPLASISIVEKISDYYQNIICEELNVKEVKILDNPDAIAKKICMPNAKKIGPKLGKETQAVIDAAKRGEFKDLGDGNLEINGKVISTDEYEMAFLATDTLLDVQAGFGTVIAMDMHVSEELLHEGVARDIVRSVQEARKEAGYSVTDKIELMLQGDTLFVESSKQYKTLIESETLSTMSDQLTNPDFTKTIEDEGESYTLSLKR